MIRGISITQQRALQVAGRSLSRIAIPESAAVHLDATAVDGLSDGDLINTWEDQVGNHDVIQANSELQPTYKTNIMNGNPVVRLANDRLTNQSLSVSQPMTVFVVVANYSKPSDNWGVFGNNSGSLVSLYWRGAYDNWSLYAGENLEGSTSTLVRMFSGVLDGDRSILREDGSQTASGNAGTTSISGLQIGDRDSKDDFWDGDIAEFLLCNNRLSTLEIKEQEQRLASKWGIPI